MHSNNRVKTLRTKLKMSQRTLAGKVGVSQQHIQRLETQPMNVGLSTAAALCEALDQPMSAVFPQTRSILKGVKVDENQIAAMLSDEKTMTALNGVGIDTNLMPGSIQLRLRGRTKTINVPLAAGEKERLWTTLQDAPKFLAFSGRDYRRYLINTDHLMSWTFLERTEMSLPEFKERELDNEDDDASEKVMATPRHDDGATVRLWCADGSPIIEVEAEADDATGEYALNFIFESLERAFHFYDIDHEDVTWFSTANLALLAVPEQLICSEEADLLHEQTQSS